ncbi:MAG: M18 family aminopeptidase [Parachlamydia sp.]|jgi:aspartyl aminopeptidase|nr:M18 family aminopeptidase [Parachlamydia sp.]
MHNSSSLTQSLIDFLDSSPTAWHAVANVAEKFKQVGFTELNSGESWPIEKEGRYFVNHRGSSFCAFVLPKTKPKKLRLFTSHTDSPGFKLKPKPETHSQTVQLAVEIYGAPLLNSWLNRDLGLAGRVYYTTHDKQTNEALVRLDEDPVMIPQLAIHLDRDINEKGLLLNKQEHLNALAALSSTIPPHTSLIETILRKKIDYEELIAYDLFLYPLEKARLIGYQGQLLASYRIDSLASVHAAMEALTAAPSPLDDEIKMVFFWDHEEIGSQTSLGAKSPFFNHTLERLLTAIGCSREDYFRLLSQSLCVSIDLAHALHPNHKEKHDPHHQPILGKGVVLKNNAQARYATDASSSLPIRLAAKKLGLPLQEFVSRNDMPCGTTIGPLQACNAGMPTVDIGCAQLSMHSIREIMSIQDHADMTLLLRTLME